MEGGEEAPDFFPHALLPLTLSPRPRESSVDVTSSIRESGSVQDRNGRFRYDIVRRSMDYANDGEDR